MQRSCQSLLLHTAKFFLTLVFLALFHLFAGSLEPPRSLELLLTAAHLLVLFCLVIVMVPPVPVKLIPLCSRYLLQPRASSLVTNLDSMLFLTRFALHPRRFPFREFPEFDARLPGSFTHERFFLSWINCSDRVLAHSSVST